MSAPTWRNEEQLAWIRQLSRGKRDALEIGTYCGAGARALCESVSGLVFSIEPLGYSPENEEEIESQTADKEGNISALAREYPLKFIHIAGRSEHQIWARPLDIIVIDGDHSEAGVFDAASRFVPSLQSGGVVFIDAYDHPNKPGVKPGWDRWLKESALPLWPIGNVRNLHAWRLTYGRS